MSPSADLTRPPHAHSSRCYWDFRRPGWVCQTRTAPVELRVPAQRAEAVETADHPTPVVAPVLTPS
jgi:hypothetical protein